MKVIVAGGQRNGVVSEILRGFLRHLCRAGLLEICIVQRLITLPSVKEHAGIGTLHDGASTLAKLGLIKAY
jgi:hypothetical protein